MTSALGRAGAPFDRRDQRIGLCLDGKYELRSLLAEGAQGAIYEAVHVGLERLVAIKLLRAGPASDDKALTRMRHEAQVVAALKHPNICEIFDFGTTSEGRPFLVMERLVGETLADRIVSQAPMGFLDLAPILKQMLAALAFAHDTGVVHRDLKPENVFLERRRGQLNAKLLDFGISKWLGRPANAVDEALGASDVIACTPYYMSPEQARGDSNIDHRVDLWAVGVIMYEALTGRRPFVAPNYNALLVRILTSPVRPVDQVEPEIHPVISELVQRALAKMREDRFQSASELRRAVGEAQEICLSEDSFAPTMVMRRRKRAPTPAPVRGAHVWTGRVDDPDTHIDDDLGQQHQNRLQWPIQQLDVGRQQVRRSSDLPMQPDLMPLPLPPRVERRAPPPPASIVRIHRLSDLFPGGRPAVVDPGPGAGDVSERPLAPIWAEDSNTDVMNDPTKAGEEEPGVDSSRSERKR